MRFSQCAGDTMFLKNCITIASEKIAHVAMALRAICKVRQEARDFFPTGIALSSHRMVHVNDKKFSKIFKQQR